MSIVNEELGLPIVPVLSESTYLEPDVDSLLKLAEGKSVLNENVEREGIVIRGLKDNFSFKVISNKFLLESGD